jgi:hypothetical protein
VHHVRLNKVEAVVFWDGRSSMEVVPIKYLELDKLGEPAPCGGTDYIIAPDKAPHVIPLVDLKAPRNGLPKNSHPG